MNIFKKEQFEVIGFILIIFVIIAVLTVYNTVNANNKTIKRDDTYVLDEWPGEVYTYVLQAKEGAYRCFLFTQKASLSCVKM